MFPFTIKNMQFTCRTCTGKRKCYNAVNEKNEFLFLLHKNQKGKREEAEMLKISRLTVENLTEGCVTDREYPRISFCTESGKGGTLLSKAVITVGDWSIETAEQIAVMYGGPALKPFTKYDVTVKAVDDTGEEAEAFTSFETGRMNIKWDARWITDGAYHFTESKISPKPMMFRKKIRCQMSGGGKCEIAEARIYATALGIYELMLNGKKVGQDYFAPGFTSYKNQLQYQTYDVTQLLETENELTAVVAGGWAAGSFTYKRRNRVYAKRQALLLELHIRYADGTKEVIGTDESWQVTEEGNYREAEFYNGEIYDATVVPDKITWRGAAAEQVNIKPQIMAQYGSPVRAHEEFTPVFLHRTKSGEMIYDFGQNFAGVIKAWINGTQGQRIIFRHAEILMDGELYTEPLRTAKQEAVYICRAGRQYYSPRMTYMGFRYVGVTGIDKDDLELTAAALYSDIGECGSFACSSELVNRLQQSIRWGAKSNFVDIPTDCPQRDERMGWTGDIALFSPTAAYNFDMSRFLEKWLLDVKSEQTRGGGIPVTVPLVRVPMQWEIMVPMAVDHWGDACILVPWAEYRARGDVGILKSMYPVMKRYMKACRFWSGLFSFGNHRYIWKLLHHYGDWCAPKIGMWAWMGRGKWTATACMAHSAAIVSRIAEILGKTEDAVYYRNLSKKTSLAYRKILMEDDCRVKKEFQTAYVLPLYYEMLSTEDKRSTASNLVRLIRENDYHIGTGFPGTPYVLFALADNGYIEDAYRMLLTDTCPSWLYEVKVGGTTIWERWDALREDGTCNTGKEDGTGGMVSFNHYASGAVGDFLYRRVAGIEAQSGGYRKFRIAPLIGGGLTWARGTVKSPYGTIESFWHYEDGRFSIEVKVPMGTICELNMPGGEVKNLRSGCYRFEEELQESGKKEEMGGIKNADGSDF